MFKPNLDQLNEFLDLIYYECPSDVYGELSEISCTKSSSCYDCWRYTLLKHQKDLLKNKNDCKEV